MLTIKVRPLILFLAIIGLGMAQYYLGKDLYKQGYKRGTEDTISIIIANTPKP